MLHRKHKAICVWNFVETKQGASSRVTEVKNKSDYMDLNKTLVIFYWNGLRISEICMRVIVICETMKLKWMLQTFSVHVQEKADEKGNNKCYKILKITVVKVYIV